MINRVAKFEKVSFEQFLTDYCDTLGGLDINDEETIVEARSVWNTIRLPKRSTKGSAGYDICSTIDFIIKPNQTVKIPTGIRCKMEDGWVLKIYPRSGLGFKYRAQLNNTVGIIDEDYYYSDNEGHIFVKITNDSNEDKVLSVNIGDKIVQGIFVPFGITIDDDVNEVRNGGFGSTGK